MNPGPTMDASVGAVHDDGIAGIARDRVTPVRLAGQVWTGDASSPVHAPYDGRLLGHVPACGAAEVDAAVKAAKAALDEEPLPQWRRAEILDQAAQALDHHHEQFSRCIALEAAKPIRAARIEVDRAISTFQFSAAAARTLAGDVVPLEASQVGVGKVGFVLRVPIGVVAAIAPFNFPLNLVAHKLGPAIAAGCPVVLKPAAQTPFSAILLAQILLQECGLPADYLHVVTGAGGVVGRALVDHDDVALITFTGSPEVGWSIRARAPRKRVGLELGNNAPLIIDEGSDWRTAVEKVKLAGFSHAGQSCISTQRILVHTSIYEVVVAELVAASEALVVGDPLDEATDVSALISSAETNRVVEWVREAQEQGARLASGGTLDSAGVLRPTVLADVEPAMKVSCLEVFGPVVAVSSFQHFEEALTAANNSRYGLQAGVFTSDVTRAMKAARTLDYGGVLINEVPTWRTDQQPYGGLRDSGNTREGPAWAVREMTEERLVVISG